MLSILALAVASQLSMSFLNSLVSCMPSATANTCLPNLAANTLKFCIIPSTFTKLLEFKSAVWIRKISAMDVKKTYLEVSKSNLFNPLIEVTQPASHRSPSLAWAQAARLLCPKLAWICTWPVPSDHLNLQPQQPRPHLAKLELIKDSQPFLPRR